MIDLPRRGGAGGLALRLAPNARPPLPRGQDAPRLLADRLHIRSEPLQADAARADQRRLLERSLTNLRQAESDYQQLIAAQPPTQTAATPRRLPGFSEQITIDGMSAGFPRSRLDRLWANLVEHGQIALIVPSLCGAARDQLLRLGAQAEKELGRPVTISVRQTADDDQRLPPPRAVLLSRLRTEPADLPQPAAPPRPPMPAGDQVPRLPADRFHNWLETMKGEHASVAQRRILHLALVDPSRAALDYQDLVAAEPGMEADATDGVLRATTDGMFSAFGESTLDVFWADLVERRQLRLAVPSVSAESRDQLLRLGAQAENHLKGSVTIFIRETA